MIFALHAYRGLLSAQVGEGNALVADMRDDYGGHAVNQKQASQAANSMFV